MAVSQAGALQPPDVYASPVCCYGTHRVLSWTPSGPQRPAGLFCRQLSIGRVKKAFCGAFCGAFTGQENKTGHLLGLVIRLKHSRPFGFGESQESGDAVLRIPVAGIFSTRASRVAAPRSGQRLARHARERRRHPTRCELLRRWRVHQHPVRIRPQAPAPPRLRFPSLMQVSVPASARALLAAPPRMPVGQGARKRFLGLRRRPASAP
jgi:hypothetical protein